jgi:Holliday junction resolvase RusA-like endonuclease
MLTFEFVRLGAPCSVQIKNKDRMDNYKRDVRRAAVACWPGNSSPVTVPVGVIITYFYTQDILDVDNIIKPVLDQLKMLVYADDRQVTSVTCRKINIAGPEAVIANASLVLFSGLRSRSDFLHVLVEWE